MYIMTMRLGLLLATVAVAAWCITGPSAHAQDEKPLDRNPVKCINFGRLERMAFVDDKAILFFLPGDRVYLNTLDMRCPHLDQNVLTRGWITPSRIPRLCANELMGSVDGACKLGEFEPITVDEAKQLLARADHNTAAADTSGPATPPSRPLEESPPTEHSTTDDPQQ